MSAKSSEKSPSILGVYFCATLMALLGAVLGFFYMASFELQEFSSEAEYQASLADIEEPTPGPTPGDAYYIKGELSRTRTWEPKRLQLTAAGAQTVRFTEAEINAWMDAKFRSGASPSGEGEPNILVVPGVPNLGIADSETIYVNLPTTITAFGMSRDLTISARCGLDGTSSMQFQSVHFSGAKLPLPRMLGAQVYNVLVQGYQATEEYTIMSEAFARADSIRVEGGDLVFQLR